MWLKWLPWRFIVKRVAKAHGFLDPIALQSRMHRFLQPSEVAEPIELLRAGAVMHARGLINSRVVQHNLDWVWPYWIQRQFDPADESFVPRAFSITHINLTHRSWTALGVPGYDELPIVDPCGLLTPFYDGWSIDAWVIGQDGAELLPSRCLDCRQTVEFEGGYTIKTMASGSGMSLQRRASVVVQQGAPVCRMTVQATATHPAWLVLALRPCNPEGISFIHDIELSSDHRMWLVDGKHTLRFDTSADVHHVSNYSRGDVYIHLRDSRHEVAGACDAGMLTAAALFKLEPSAARTVEVEIPLPLPPQKAHHNRPLSSTDWQASLEHQCRIEIPDEKCKFLYDAALRTLVLHSPGDVYPGPFTYKRFWFRDAAFIIHALLNAGFADRAERAIDRFGARQQRSGYFHSQDGEWDSNGQALWIMWRFCQLTHSKPKPMWQATVCNAAEWILNKRTSAESDGKYVGLLPAGFSAEHLGPNDFYYWDDFWGVAGLQAASALCLVSGDDENAARFTREGLAFLECIDSWIDQSSKRLGRAAIAAAPSRRLDAGTIGSLVAAYPLQLYRADDPRVVDCTKFLLDRCFVDGAFFQDMIHSGLNAYLTLHVAQVLLAADDPRYLDAMDAVAALASPTGQWPEANHPRTRGGCMGDGQHAWAAAEWVMMVRNCFVRETSDRLILGSGVPGRWLKSREPIRFGPAATPFGSISLEIVARENSLTVTWHGEWVHVTPEIEIRVPGWPATAAQATSHSVTVTR